MVVVTIVPWPRLRARGQNFVNALADSHFNMNDEWSRNCELEFVNKIKE